MGPKKPSSASPDRKKKPIKKAADDGQAKASATLNSEDRDIYQEPIKKIVRPHNQVGHIERQRTVEEEATQAPSGLMSHETMPHSRVVGSLTIVLNKEEEAYVRASLG